MKQQTKIFTFRSLLLGIVAFVLGISIYSWNTETLLGNKMPMPFGMGVSIVMSGSMEPTLEVNDLVFIKKSEEIKENDIIVFQEENHLIIHRVVEIDGEDIITKGDANNMVDAPIHMESVKGVMIGKIGSIGVLVQILKQPAVGFILVVFALCFAEMSFRKEKEEDREDLENIKQEIEELMKEVYKD